MTPPSILSFPQKQKRVFSWGCCACQTGREFVSDSNFKMLLFSSSVLLWASVGHLLAIKIPYAGAGLVPFSGDGVFRDPKKHSWGLSSNWHRKLASRCRYTWQVKCAYQLPRGYNNQFNTQVVFSSKLTI